MRVASLAFDWLGFLFGGDPTYERYKKSKTSIATLSDRSPIFGDAESLIAEALREGFDLSSRAKPRVTVIIPSFGNFHHTLACLRSIDRHKGAIPFQVQVVDDASGEATLPLFANLPGVNFRSNAINLGFVLNCNEAARSVSSDFIYLLNNDTEVTSGWLDSLVDVMDRRDDVGIVGSKLLFPNGTLQEAGGIMWADASAWNWGRSDQADRPCFNFVRETDYVSGASLLVRTKLWRALGGFDQHYMPAYCEDSDLAFRARARGWRVCYQPASVLIHYEGVSHGTDLESGGKAHQTINQAKFRERWRDVLEREHFPNGEHLFLARDRSRNKSHILVIDHYVPQPDRDAGSRTIMSFIKSFLDLDWHVVFWPHNGWYDPQYAPVLQQLGVEVIYGDEAANGIANWLKNSGLYIDVVLVSRPDVYEEFAPVIRQHSRAPIVYYGHDIHHRRMLMEAELNPKVGLASATEVMRLREMSIWYDADIVLYPSAEESAMVANALSDAPHKSKPIQPYVFDIADSKVDRKVDQNLVIFVAGFGHPPNVDAATWLVKEIMPRVWSVAPQMKLALIGSNPTEDVKRLAGDRVDVTGFVSDEVLKEYYRSACIALVPLRIGAGVKSKVVEAFANGVPLVTTTVGMQGLEDSQGVAEVHDQSEDFASAVIRMLNDEDLRYFYRRRGLAYADRFSEESMRKAWSMILGEVTHQRSKEFKDLKG
jgi:GT2 family glycosyltransferase